MDLTILWELLNVGVLYIRGISRKRAANTLEMALQIQNFLP